MSYVVLARKWRPATFGDMTGQEHVVRTLANAIAAGRVAHAYLFCGPRGVGKTTAARLLARALNCAKGPTAEPCGQCAPCTEISAGTSVDVAEIDGASNNGVEDVRQIRERVMYLPHRDRHKIYIIDEVHMLSGAAFNALLKTLEEPPPHVKFIFATTEPHKLPDTILSRCQRHNFRRIGEGAMVKRLRHICDAEAIAISDCALSMFARQAEGGMRDALSLLEQTYSSYGSSPSDADVAEALGTVDRTAVHEACRALVRRDAKTVLAVVEEQYVRGVELKRLAEEAALYLRHLIVTKVQGSPPQELADVERAAVAALAADIDVAQLSRLFDVVHGAVAEVGRAPQPRIALEVTLLKALHLAPSSAIPDLIARVEELARSLGSPAPGGGAAPVGRDARSPSCQPPRDVQRSRESERRAYGADASVGAQAATEAPAAREEEVRTSPAKPEPAAVAPAGLATAGDASPVAAATPFERWKAAIEAVRAKRARVALSLAHGRLLSLANGEAVLGFVPEDGFHRVQTLKWKGDVEKLLAAHFGAPVRIRVEDATEGEAALSPAQEAAEAGKAKAEKAARRVREDQAVQAAVRVLGGNVENIRLSEPMEQGAAEESD